MTPSTLLRLLSASKFSRRARGYCTAALAGWLCAAPAAPVAGADILLAWRDNSGNESGFRIERSSDGLPWQEIAVIGADATRHVDTVLPPAVLCSYRVRACNSAGNSAYSNIASATVVPPVPVNEPPTISAIASQTILAGTSTAWLAFTIADADSPAAALSVLARSSNPTLVPMDRIQWGDGMAAVRTIRVTPVLTQSGVTTITLAVSDGTHVAETSFLVRVELATTPPIWVLPPTPVVVDAGGAFELTALATGEGPVAYQWYRDGVAISGATAARYAVPSAQRFHGGTYHVVATSGGRATTGEAVAVDVRAAPTASGRLLNLSTRAWCATGDAVLIPGLVVKGGRQPGAPARGGVDPGQGTVRGEWRVARSPAATPALGWRRLRRHRGEP